MKERIATAIVLMLLLSVSGFAIPIVYEATLNGSSEFPGNASPGTGFAIVTIDTTAHLMRVEVTFQDLIAGTTASHIHCCVLPSAPTPTAGVATQTPTFTGFPLGVTSGSYDHFFDTSLASTFNAAFITANGGTVAGAETALAQGLANGMAYLNVHTSQFPSGEIRGFLNVPELSSVVLLGMGLLGIASLRKRG